MRKFFTTLKSVVAIAIIASMTLAASCSYDDTALKNQVEKIEQDLAALTERVAALEQKLADEVESLEALIDGKVVVVDVVTDAEGNQTIKLSNGKEITVLAPVECDSLQYRVVDGVLQVSADGENWIPVQVAPECVVANIVISQDGNSATITLASGEEFTVVKAELIECEATRSQVYVIAGATKALPFSINDAVVDINVMNQPFGWSATVEEAVAEEENGDDAGIMPLAAGGKNYVLKVNGPSQELVNAGYAAKEGVVSVHFNTAAGACKVLSVNVNLAEITLNVDVAGNITITNTVAMEQTNYWGEKFVDFADFWIGVMPKALYDTYGVDALRNDAGSWGDFNSSYVTQRSTGLSNVAELQQYQEGVYENETITLTVDQLGQAFYPSFVPQIGGEYVIFISTESEVLDYYQIPLLDNAIFASYKKTIVEASLVEGSETWNDATFNFNLAGFDNFLIGWMSVAEVEMYMSYGMGSSVEEILPQYISAYGVMSSGAILAGNYLDQTIKLSELAGMSLMEWAPTLATNTEYYFYVYPFNAQTEMEFYQHKLIPENLYYFGTFSTAALVAGEFDANAQFEVLAHEEKEISVNVTLAEDVVSVAYNWYASSFMDPEEAVATIMGDEYYTTFIDLDETKSFLAEDYDYYGLNNPTYLGIVAINANGEYVYVEKEFTYVEPVLPQVAITSFEFLGRSYDLDEDESTAGGDYVYALTCEDGTQYKLGLYYSYANEDGSIIEGTYTYCTNKLNSMYSSWSGFVIESDTFYTDSVLTVTADQIIWKIKGVVEYVFNKNAQGGDEPEEQGIVLTMSEVDGGYNDMTIYLSNENVLVALNFYECTNSNVLPEGTYEVRGGAGAIYTGGYSYITFSDGSGGWLWGGSVTVSEVDGKYRFDLDVAYGDANTPFKAVYEGALDGFILPSEYVAPEPETIEVGAIDRAKYNGYIQFFSADGLYCVVLYPWEIIDSNKLYIPEGTYNFAYDAGSIYPSYSRLYNFEIGEYTHVFDDGGVMTVAEVNGAYHIEVSATLEGGMANMEFVYDGLIEGLILPSEYTEAEPEPEPEIEVISFNAVRADYDNKFDLFEYNGGDAEYAFWLYDENNNYIEVIHRFGSHTGWDDVYEAKMVMNGVETVATTVNTQKPNTWNCGDGELYFVVEAVFENATSVSVYAQLPATERNFLGEGSTYAPGSENQGGEPSEPEVLPEFVIPGEGVAYTYDYRYTKLVDGLDANNSLRVKQDNGWTWDIKFNTGLTEIVAGDYKATNSSFSSPDALEVDTYNGGFQNDAYNYIYPDEYEKVTTFNVQVEGDYYCITMIGSGGYGSNAGDTYRCVYIGKIYN